MCRTNHTNLTSAINYLMGFESCWETYCQQFPSTFFPLNASWFIRPIREPNTPPKSNRNLLQNNEEKRDRPQPCHAPAQGFHSSLWNAGARDTFRGPRMLICTLKGEIPQQVSHKRWSTMASSRLAGKKILVGFTQVNISGPAEETRALDLCNYIDTLIFSLAVE